MDISPSACLLMHNFLPKCQHASAIKIARNTERVSIEILVTVYYFKLLECLY